jgi:hypothetical protein
MNKLVAPTLTTEQPLLQVFITEQWVWNGENTESGKLLLKLMTEH